MIAKNILDATSELFPLSKITTREMGIWVLENVKMPSVLFESGYISNSNDLQFVKGNISRIAIGILEAIESYLSQENTLKNSLPISKNEIFNNAQNINKLNVKKNDTTGYQVVSTEITISNKIKPDLNISSYTEKYVFDSSMIWPVENGIITDKFGKVLVPETKNIFTDNSFLTIATDESANVRSIKNGEVSYIGNLSDNESFVIIKHNEINSTYSNIIPNIKIGQKVSRGQIIGTVNKSIKGQYALTFGISDGNGSFMDPENLRNK